MRKELNIISFDVPYPANYGGVIDVFFKLKTLHSLGIKIYFHCFEYGRGQQRELEKYAHKVFYYKRKLGIKSLLSAKPYIVKSRESDELLANLMTNNAPIIFEGLHTCAYLSHPILKDRIKIVRTHNIEHQYYFSLAKKSGSFVNRLYYLIEAIKLKKFESILKQADYLFPISIADEKHFKKYSVDIMLITPFNGNQNFNNKEGKGNYILFHGNLSVKENSEIAQMLIDDVFNRINEKLIIAGLNPAESLKNKIKSSSNCELIENPSSEKMDKLITNAHIIILFTNQATGIKLKLIESLYKGRFCLCNDKMIHGTGITDKSVTICNKTDYSSMSKVINELNAIEFTKEDIEKRSEEIGNIFNDKENAKLIYNLV